MNRRNILQFITLCYLAISAGVGLWVNHIWQASSPAYASTVQGISTTQQTATPTPATQLLPYPTLSLPSNAGISARQFALYNANTGKTLIRSQNMLPMAMASTTKMMTARVVRHHADLKEEVTISPKAASQIGSIMGVYAGEKITVQDLLYGALLVSGNDASQALAEHVGGKLLNNPQASPEEKTARFVTEMNAEADRLFLENTHFINPVGLDDVGHHSTAVDLAKLASLLLKDPFLKQAIATSDITVYNTAGTDRFDLHNSNRLLADVPYAGMQGGKTGYTDEAGHCLIVSATRNGVTLVAAILHTQEDTKEASAMEARKLLDLGFNSIRWE